MSAATQPKRKPRLKSRTEFEPVAGARSGRRKAPPRPPEGGSAAGEDAPAERWEPHRGAFPGDRAG